MAWVRNLQTGRISPQFHVVSDNWFEAVELNDETETPPEWDVIATWSTFVSNADQPEDHEGHKLDDELLKKNFWIAESKRKMSEIDFLQQEIACRKPENMWTHTHRGHA